MAAVAERLRLRSAAAAQDEVLLDRVRISVGVGQRHDPFDEIGPVLTNLDRNVLHTAGRSPETSCLLVRGGGNGQEQRNDGSDERFQEEQQAVSHDRHLLVVTLLFFRDYGDVIS